MNNEERDRFIAGRLGEGVSLSDVQRLLANEHGINLTYLELRLIAADLEVNWEKQDKKRQEARSVVPETDLVTADDGPAEDTKVTVSKVVRPGAQMSGDVEFKSGAKAEWYLDSYGRLGLNPSSGSGSPTEDDLREFQAALQQKLTGGAA